MITEREAVGKLYEMSDKFRSALLNKKYGAAKSIYENAVAISTFLELPAAEMLNLFGNRPYVDDEKDTGIPVKNGLFSETDVLRMYEKYILSAEEQLADIEKRKRYMERIRIKK